MSVKPHSRGSRSRTISRVDLDALELVSKAIGPLPLINRFLERLRLDPLLTEFVPHSDPRLRLAPSVGLGVLVRNVLVSRRPLYGLAEWAQPFDVSLLGLPAGAAERLNDDRVGRCLDALFRADRAGLVTAVVSRAVRTFDVDLSELHNDSTTITFSGQYPAATGQPHQGRPTHRITYGHNKDHRPDLKQLLYILTTTADGTVPIWCSVEHGNTTDGQTHIETWDALCRLAGSSGFLYVADCKLCSRENMQHIAQNGGRFVTVLHRTRQEDSWFRDWVQAHDVPWTELLRRPHPRRQDGPDDVYRGFESPLRSVEGYRILWIWSSQKAEQDRDARQGRIEKAIDQLEQLRARIQGPRSRLKTPAQVEQAAQSILQQTQTERWIHIHVDLTEAHHFTQAGRGRPGKNTRYLRRSFQRPTLHWTSNADTLQYDTRTDGIFPLITNDDTLSIQDTLVAYKHQPSLEKRHEQLKSVFDVRPVLLKSHTRIEAFLVVYFFALLVQALIERDIRHRMKQQGIVALPLYPEERPCQAPTASRIFEIFAQVRRHRLVTPDGTVYKRFNDDLTPLQRTVLQLLRLPPAAYFTTGDEDPPRVQS